MKHIYSILLALCLVPILTGCLATSGDLQRLADAQAELEQVLEDRGASDADLESALREYGAELDAVAADVKARGEGLLDDLTNPANWTPAGLVGAAVMYLRSQSRRKELANVVREQPPA